MDILGNITLHKADCMELLRDMPDKAYDLAIVDPPYGLSEKSTQGSGKLRNRALNRGRIMRWDNAPPPEYFDQLLRVSKNAIIWGGNYFGLPRCRGFICWDKEQPFENFSQVEMHGVHLSGRQSYSGSTIGPAIRFTPRKSPSRSTNGCWNTMRKRATEYSTRIWAAAR